MMKNIDYDNFICYNSPKQARREKNHMEKLRSEIAHAIGVMTTDTLPNIEYKILESTKGIKANA